MALSVEDREVRPLTADEVLRMVDAGILAEDERVELLHGALTAMSPKSPEHVTVLHRMVPWALSAAGPAMRLESPLRVPDQTSLPEPDLAIVDDADYSKTHPTTALLVVEVSVSSLRVDLRLKPPLYAVAGVADYWVVDVPAHSVRVFRDPTPGGYETQLTVRPGDALRALAVEAPPLDVAALFAGL